MRLKVLSILTGAMLLFLMVDFSIHRRIIFQSYLTLEETGAGKDINRCIGALEREIEHLSILTYDWAAWDDTYRFVQDHNSGYLRSNLVEETFSDNQIHLVFIIDNQRRVVWGQVRDPETFGIIDLEEFRPENVMAVQHLLEKDEPGEVVSGVWPTSRQAMLISSCPITTSEDQGPVLGHFLMGRFVTDFFIEDLSVQTQVPHRYDLLRNGIPDSAPADILERITADTPVAFERVCADLMKAYAIVPDFLGDPALLLQADIERLTMSQGRSALWHVLTSVGVMGALLLAVILLFLSRMVVRPLLDLTHQVKGFGENQRFSPSPLVGRRDEISVLYREFKKMATHLQEVHQGLQNTNARLENEIHEHSLAEEELRRYQGRLRALSSEQVMLEERERRHIAAELHDRIGQALAVLRMRIESLLLEASAAPKNAGEIRALIEDIIQDSRTLIFEISPPVLYELGLGPAIEWLAEEIMGHHDIQIEVLDQLEASPEDRIRALIFRSVRELLYNVVKHADADRAWVKLTQTEDDIEVVVEDNGVGLSPEEEARGGKTANGFGLFSIQERFRQLGGDFTISPQGETGGTVAILLLPVDFKQDVLHGKNMEE